MTEALDILLTASFWVAAIRIASPLIFATMGELICERAGVLNLGIEGIMTAGAFVGWITVYAGGDLWLGVMRGRAGRDPVRRDPRLYDGAAGPVPACHGDRCHAPGHEPDLFHLSCRLAGGDDAAADRTVPGLADPDPLGHPARRAGPVRTDADDLSRLCDRRHRRLGTLPNTSGPGGACGRRESFSPWRPRAYRSPRSAWAR